MQHAHRPLCLRADRGVDCRRVGHASAGRAHRPMFHVKHRVSMRLDAARAMGPVSAHRGRTGRSGTELIPVSSPVDPSVRPDSAGALRRRSRADPSSPRNISSPLHRRPRATPAHAGARATSSSARSPLTASISPPERSSGKLHFATLSSDATALETTASISPTCSRTAALFGSAADDRHVDRQAHRRPRAGNRCAAAEVR